MSVSPLDMQTLFSNLKNIGQQQAAERNAVIAQQSRQADEQVKKAEERENKVSEAKEDDSGPGKVDDHGKNRNMKQKDSGKGKNQEEGEKEEDFFTDPDIGHNIDISG